MKAMSKVKLPGSNSMKVLALLMLCALWAMVGVFVTVNKQAELDQRRLASTGEQKVLSQRIAKYSLAASAGDYQAFGNAVSGILRERSPSTAQCIEHAQGFAWPRFNAQLRAEIERLLNRD